MELKEILKELEEEADRSGNNEVNIKFIINKYLKHWLWFVASIIICSTLAVTYIYFATPV